MIRAMAFVALFIFTLSSNARALELDIGHFETSDDPDGLNWLFFHCDEDGNILDCNIVQTLISYELAATDRAKRIEEDLKGNPVDDFMKQGCDKDKITENRAAIAAKIKTSKGFDGRPLRGVQVDDILRTIDALADACLKPNPVTVRRLIEIQADNETRTCVINNRYSHTRFHLSEDKGVASTTSPTGEAPKKWIAQEGPTGPCGFMNIVQLERTPTSPYWLFTERKIKTNPDGIFPSDGTLGGHSCSEFAETTFKYTWGLAKNNSAQCAFLKHG